MLAAVNSSCSEGAEGTVTDSLSSMEVSSCVSCEPDSFFSLWNGENITADNASDNGCIFIGSNNEYSDKLWDEFYNAADKGRNAEITSCTENSVMNLKISGSDEDYRCELKIKTLDEESGRVCENTRMIDPPRIWRKKNEDIFEYYLCNFLIYTRPCGESETDGDYGIETTTDFQIYPVSSAAGMVFPYKKTFSSYSDFESYYQKYNGELSLDEMKTDMKAYDDEGGFNAHVIFLYGDMAGSEDVTYEYINAVRNGAKLFIYVKKSISAQKNPGISKWQLVCTVPGEQLSDVSPDCINWVVYTDSES